MRSSGCAEIDGVSVIGPPDAERRGGVISFAIDGMHPHDIAELLDRDERLRPRRPPLRPAADARARRAAPRPALASGPTTTRADVDALIESLVRARSVFA